MVSGSLLPHQLHGSVADPDLLVEEERESGDFLTRFDEV